MARLSFQSFHEDVMNIILLRKLGALLDFLNRYTQPFLLDVTLPDSSANRTIVLTICEGTFFNESSRMLPAILSRIVLPKSIASCPPSFQPFSDMELRVDREEMNINASAASLIPLWSLVNFKPSMLIELREVFFKLFAIPYNTNKRDLNCILGIKK